MAMFTAYFDASGNKRTRVLSIAGFVSQVPKWERFEKEWRTLLPPTVQLFHMKDFVSSRKGWEQWKGHSVKRVWFVSRLVACIRRHIHNGFSAQVSMAHYRAMDAEFAFSEKFASPYSLVGFGCLKQLKQWAEKKGIDARNILCIFEEGDDDQGVFIDRAKKDGFDVTPRSKKHIRAFDACDLAAWRAKAVYDDPFFRDFGIKEKPTLDKLHASLDELEKIIPNGGVFSLDAMRTMCLRAHVPRRV
jgi:hypothetical protein